MTLFKKGVWLHGFKLCDKIQKLNFASLRNEVKCKKFYTILKKWVLNAYLMRK